MVRTVAAVLLIAWLASPVVSAPRTTDPPHHDRDGATTASTPWIDLAPSKLLADLAPADPEPIDEAEPASRRDHKAAATLTLGGLYAGFTTWTYFAWYRKHEKKTPASCAEHRGDYRWGLCWGGDGWFAPTTYAGGADKLGHAWSTMALARAGTELLHQWGGYDKLTAAIIGTALSEALFIGVEVKDGAYYEFSYGDFAFDSAGAVLALALSASPRLDELIDFRVQYWPSKAYRDQLTNDGNVNIAEDYSGQTYLFALHLGGIHRLRDARYGRWSRYLDVAVGFETRGYKPDQLDGAMDFPHTQKLFFGLTLNAQGLFDDLLGKRARPAAKITHGFFEVFNAPYATLPVVDGTRSAMTIDMDGA